MRWLFYLGTDKRDELSGAEYLKDAPTVEVPDSKSNNSTFSFAQLGMFRISLSGKLLFQLHSYFHRSSVEGLDLPRILREYESRFLYEIHPQQTVGTKKT